MRHWEVMVRPKPTAAAALSSLLLSMFAACGPPPQPVSHPGLQAYGTPCAASKCDHDLECVRVGDYGGEAGSCEKRCNYDDDCGVGARCTMVEKAPAPLCRAKGG